MKEKRPIPLYKALKRRIILPALAVWLIAMLLLSLAVGKDFYYQLEQGSESSAQAMLSYMSVEDLPGSLDYAQLSTMSFAYLRNSAAPLLPIVLPQKPSSIGNRDWYWGMWELVYGYQAAVAYYDANGNLTHKSGNYLFFPYSNTLGGEHIGYTYVRLDDVPGGKDFAETSGATHLFQSSGFVMSGFQLTGTMETDGSFIPASVTQILTFEVEAAPPEGGSSVEELVYRTHLQNPDIPANMTIYTSDLHICYYDPGTPVRFPGVDTMKIERAVVTDTGFQTRYTPFSASIATKGWAQDGSSVRLLICIRPLAYAAVRLLPTYLVSGILLWVGLWLCLKSVKKNLKEPLEVINRSWENDRAELSVFARSPFLELQELAAHFDTAQQDRHGLRNQVTQLQTALNYAKDAEENRRRMISSIAHELKTPLAVIHGYAEGLQDGIAPQKQQQYLSIILDETEKTDWLVQQMLELSRLEAGKVRLSADQVDLAALTLEVLEKLSLSAQQRELTIRHQLYPTTLTADRSRLEQVLTNYISNAIKYSPRGGTIGIILSKFTDYVLFTIENESEPLSQEALSRVWDSFYRADTARDRTGTGLGLAITKSIVELHRGTCAVRNTKTGVEFSFRLPTGSNAHDGGS